MNCRLTLLLGAIAISGSAAAQMTVYDNLQTPQNVVVRFGNYSTLNNVTRTYCLLDDLTLTQPGQLSSVTVKLTTNHNGPAVGHANLVFFGQDGTSGAPGTFLGSYTSATMNFQDILATFDLTASNIVLPSNKIWCGLYFDNAGSPGSNLDSIFIHLYNPPAIGSSADRIAEMLTDGPIVDNSQPCSVFDQPYNFFGGAVGNYGMSVQVVPEPASMLVLGGLGLLSIRRRRR